MTTSKELVQAALNCEEVDRIPFFPPFQGFWALNYSNVTVMQSINDPKIAAEAQLRVIDDCHIDGLETMWDWLIPAEVMGCGVKIPETGTIPTLTHIINEEGDLDKIELPDPKVVHDFYRFKAARETTEILADKIGNDHYLVVSWPAPFTIAGEFRGVEAMMKYVAENVKYPESAKENNLQGRVIVKFVIEKDGSVSNVEVGRGWGNELDDEAVRVVKAMPKWKPGKQDGKPVRVSFMLPINFKLSDGTPTKGPLMGTTWTGTGTGKKGNVTYEMSWTINFTDGRDGLIMMTLWSKEKKGEKKVEFDDVPLPFEYTYDGKSTGSINPVNPDNTPMGGDQIPPYGFVISPDNTMRINLFDMKEEVGIGEIVLKKQK